MSWGTWVERFPAGDTTHSWRGEVAWGVFDNGQALAVVDTDTANLYLSFDGGGTWTDALPIPAMGYIHSFAASSDCQHLVIGDDDGSVYVSADAGKTWTLVLPLGGTIEALVSCSRDGKVILNWCNLSTDYGATWTRLPIGESDGGVTAISPDGMHMVVGGTYRRIHVSADGGATWTTVEPTETATYWSSVALSADGAVILAGEHNGGVWLSRDGGATWHTVTHPSFGTRNWSGCAVSADGQKLFVGGTLWFTAGSQDGGESWTVYTWPEVASDGVMRVTISPNGEYLLVGSWRTGRLYTMGVVIPPPVIHSFPWVGKFQLSHVV